MGQGWLLHCKQCFSIQVSVEGEESCLGDICVIKFQIVLHQLSDGTSVCGIYVKTSDIFTQEIENMYCVSIEL